MSDLEEKSEVMKKHNLRPIDLQIPESSEVSLT